MATIEDALRLAQELSPIVVERGGYLAIAGGCILRKETKDIDLLVIQDTRSLSYSTRDIIRELMLHTELLPIQKGSTYSDRKVYVFQWEGIPVDVTIFNTLQKEENGN